MKYKDQIKTMFDKTKKVSCPAFPDEKIYFNSKGRSHLFYKGSDKKFTRSRKEARIRAILMPRAIKVLKNATYVQEERSYTFRTRTETLLECHSSLEKNKGKNC